MRIGTLNRRITLQRPIETQVAGGAIVKTWQDVATVWARVSYLSGLETVKANTPISISKASIKIRFREDVDARWRALDGSVIFSILNVLPDAEGREHVFLACETGANDG